MCWNEWTTYYFVTENIHECLIQIMMYYGSENIHTVYSFHLSYLLLIAINKLLAGFWLNF